MKFVVAVAVLSWAFLQVSVTGSAAERPHIILLKADDSGTQAH